MIHQFEDLGLNNDVPNTEALSKRYMLLPLHVALADEDVQYVCDKIVAFYQR